MNKASDIDISVKAPAIEKTCLFKTILFYLIQWTWGLCVNAVGGIAYLICTRALKYRHEKFGNAFIVYMPWNAGGLSMGLFIFMKDRGEEPNPWSYNTRIHEYGHTWQCLLLGPLYYIVIAIPSVIWCNFFQKYREKNNVSYYWLYCEAWANAWGQKATGLTMVDTGK